MKLLAALVASMAQATDTITTWPGFFNGDYIQSNCGAQVKHEVLDALTHAECSVNIAHAQHVFLGGNWLISDRTGDDHKFVCLGCNLDSAPIDLVTFFDQVEVNGELDNSTCSEAGEIRDAISCVELTPPTAGTNSYFLAETVNDYRKSKEENYELQIVGYNQATFDWIAFGNQYDDPDESTWTLQPESYSGLTFTVELSDAAGNPFGAQNITGAWLDFIEIPQEFYEDTWGNWLTDTGKISFNVASDYQGGRLFLYVTTQPGQTEILDLWGTTITQN